MNEVTLMKPNELKRLRAVLDSIESEVNWFKTREHNWPELILLRKAVVIQTTIAWKILGEY